MPNSGNHHIEALSPTHMDGLCGWWLGTYFYPDGKGSRTLISSCMTLITTQSTGTNFGGLLVARVCLGIFEAGFGPAVPLYFCMSTFPNV